MSTINRKPSETTMHHVHTHVCPNCGRPYSCNCAAQLDTKDVVCIDCEAGRDVGQPRSA